MKFRFFQKARLSPAMLNIERQRAFMQVIEELRREGYTEAQIRFMISHTPELQADGDENGVPDVMEAGRPAALPLSQNTYDAPRQEPAMTQPEPVRAEPNGTGTHPNG